MSTGRAPTRETRHMAYRYFTKIPDDRGPFGVDILYIAVETKDDEAMLQDKGWTRIPYARFQSEVGTERAREVKYEHAGWEYRYAADVGTVGLFKTGRVLSDIERED